MLNFQNSKVFPNFLAFLTLNCLNLDIVGSPRRKMGGGIWGGGASGKKYPGPSGLRGEAKFLCGRLGGLQNPLPTMPDDLKKSSFHGTFSLNL